MVCTSRAKFLVSTENLNQSLTNSLFEKDAKTYLK